MKHLFFRIYLQIGVNIIGLPNIHEQKVSMYEYTVKKSKFHK